MSRDPLDLVDYLSHILDAIENIRVYTAGLDAESFQTRRMVQDAVVRNFEVMGEASNNIAKRFPEYSRAHPELPPSLAYAMRNAMSHGYFEVDYEVVWNTIQVDPPAFRQLVKTAHAALHEGNGA